MTPRVFNLGTYIGSNNNTITTTTNKTNNESEYVGGLSYQSCGVLTFFFFLSGILLATIPLLPQTSHWEYYSQNGICVPLPITRKTLNGQWHTFVVVTVLNFILYLLIAAGQSVIYLAVKANLMVTDTSLKSQNIVIARRLVTVVVSNFVCWFSVSAMGLLASAGVPITGEVNAVMAIFVLPINSALNPFLYALNVLKEKQRKLRELKLLKLLQCRVVAKEAAEGPGIRARDRRMQQLADLTVPEAVRLLGQSLVSKATTVEEVRTFLEAHSHDRKCTNDSADLSE